MKTGLLGLRLSLRPLTSLAAERFSNELGTGSPNGPRTGPSSPKSFVAGLPGDRPVLAFQRPSRERFLLALSVGKQNRHPISPDIPALVLLSHSLFPLIRAQTRSLLLLAPFRSQPEKCQPWS